MGTFFFQVLPSWLASRNITPIRPKRAVQNYCPWVSTWTWVSTWKLMSAIKTGPWELYAIAGILLKEHRSSTLYFFFSPCAVKIWLITEKIILLLEWKFILQPAEKKKLTLLRALDDRRNCRVFLYQAHDNVTQLIDTTDSCSGCHI